MRLRFTIRDLLWLTAVVALAVAWWLDHHQALSLYEDANRKLQNQVRVLIDKIARQPKLLLKSEPPGANAAPD